MSYLNKNKKLQTKFVQVEEHLRAESLYIC